MSDIRRVRRRREGLGAEAERDRQDHRSRQGGGGAGGEAGGAAEDDAPKEGSLALRKKKVKSMRERGGEDVTG